LSGCMGVTWVYIQACVHPLAWYVSPAHVSFAWVATKSFPVPRIPHRDAKCWPSIQQYMINILSETLSPKVRISSLHKPNSGP
jgi:hypothetical protein